MPVEELTALRQKYKGAYDDLSDSDLAGMLAAKYPAYKDLPERVAKETAPRGQDFSKLAGGAEAKIQAPPGYLGTMARAFTEPFNQPQQEVGPYEPRPGPLSKIGRTALGTLQAVYSPFDALSRGITKFAEQNLPVSPRQAEDIGGAVGQIVANAAPMVPAALRGRAPAPVRTVDDLIARQRPALPPPAEVQALPAQPRPRGLPEPEMVMQATAPLETPGGATIASEVSRAPKRTIIELVDEIKADVKDQVIQELVAELKAGRTAARTPRKQTPLQIEGPRKALPPPKTVIYEGTPGGQLRATSALNRPIQGGGELSDLQRLQLNLRSSSPEKTPTIAPGSTIEAQPRVTPQPVSEVQPAPAQPPAPKPKFTEATPIEKILPPRAAPKAPRQILEDSEVAMSTFIKRQGGINIPKNLKEEFGGWNRLHNPKGLGVDVMADEAFNAGLLPEPTTAALLDSLKSGRKSARAPASIVNQEVEAMADSKIRQLVNVEGPLEFKGKTFTGAVREGNNVRLKDQPDKVLKKAEDILQVEEKVPFDIPPAEPEPFNPSRLRAAVQLDNGETIVGTGGRGGHKDIFEALPASQQQRVKATGFFDPTDPNPKNFYPDSAAAEQAYNARAGIEASTPAPTRKVKGPSGELVEVPTAAPKPANIQDRYALYLKTTDNPTNADYMAFISRQAHEFRQAKGLPDTAPIGTRQDFTDFIRENVEPPDIAMTKKAAPTFQQTPAGKQAVIPGAEGREVPLTPLRPKRAQTEKPMELEQPGIGAKEPGLFKIKEPPPGYKQGELPEMRETQPLSDILKTSEGTTKAKLHEQAARRSDVIYARRTGESVSDVAGVNIGDVVYDKLLDRYGKVTDKYKDAVRVVEGKNNWTIGAGNRLQKAEVIGQQGELPTVEKPRGLTGILKGEKGQIGSTETSPIVTGPRLAVGETIEQSSKTLRKTMGPEGNELADRLLKVRNNAETNTGILSQPLEAAIKKLKRTDYENFVDVLEGKAKPNNQQVADAAAIADKIRKNIARRAEAVDLQIKNPLTGEYSPFRPRENYFPHYSKEEFSKIVENPTRRAQIRDQIKLQLGEGATDKMAEDALRAMIKAAKHREPHLELARILDLGEYHKDPRVFLRYIHDANRRIAIANQFGPKLERGEELLATIGRNRGDKAESFARTLFNRELRIEEVADTLSKRMMEGARNYEVFTKLGRAFIPNMSQHVYTAVVTGVKDTAKGLAKSFTKEGRTFARRAGVVNDEILKEFYNEVSGATGEGALRKAINIELAPFQWTEKLNRIAAANAGRYHAREAFEALKAGNAKGRATLEKMGVNVEAALKRGSLSEIDELKAAQNIVNRTQFKVDPMELPLFWSSPEGRLLTQFKTFSFKSGQFMKDEILKEIGKGNVKPFIRALLILPPAGFAVKKIQNLATLNKGEKDNLADYLAAVGVFGLFSDAFRTGARTGVGTVAGPTLSDIGGAIDAATQTRQRLAEGKEAPFGPLSRFVAGQTPVAGPSLKRMLSEKTERQKLEEQLGLERKSMSREKLEKQLGIKR